jgi:hypothetical protein
MAERYERTQILLEPGQRQALMQIAQREHKSLSHIVREVVQQFLGERDAEIRKQQDLEALEQLSELREKIRQRYGIYQGDPVAEARAEREAQLERVWNDYSSD